MELLRRGAELSFVGGELDRAVGLARRALELIDDSEVVANVLARERLARYLWTNGHHRESMEQYTRAAELMPVEPPSAERALVLGALAQVRMLIGQIEDSLVLAEEAIEIARAVGDRAVESHALNTLGVDVGALGDRERGIAALRESLAIELERLSSDDLHRAYTNLGDMLDQDGQIEEAIQLALEGVEKARETGTTRSWAGFLLARPRSGAGGSGGWPTRIGSCGRRSTSAPKASPERTCTSRRASWRRCSGAGTRPRTSSTRPAAC